MGKTKEITAGVLGSCCVAWAETDTPPLKVIVSVRRRKGGCCCPWRVSSRKVAVFDFVKARRDPVFGRVTSRRAVLDVEPLLSYYQKAPYSSQVEVSVECRYKERLVGVANLEDFIAALMLQSCPEEFLLLVEDGKFVVHPSLSVHWDEDKTGQEELQWNIVKVAAKPSRLDYGSDVCEAETEEVVSLSVDEIDDIDEVEENEVIQQDISEVNNEEDEIIDVCGLDYDMESGAVLEADGVTENTCEANNEEDEIIDVCGLDYDMESGAVREADDVTEDTCEVNNNDEIVTDVCRLNLGADKGNYKEPLEHKENYPVTVQEDCDNDTLHNDELEHNGNDKISVYENKKQSVEGIKDKSYFPRNVKKDERETEEENSLDGYDNKEIRITKISNRLVSESKLNSDKMDVKETGTKWLYYDQYSNMDVAFNKDKESSDNNEGNTDRDIMRRKITSNKSVYCMSGREGNDSYNTPKASGGENSKVNKLVKKTYANKPHFRRERVGELSHRIPQKHATKLCDVSEQHEAPSTSADSPSFPQTALRHDPGYYSRRFVKHKHIPGVKILQLSISPRHDRIRHSSFSSLFSSMGLLVMFIVLVAALCLMGLKAWPQSFF